MESFESQEQYDKTIFCPLIVNLIKYFPVYSTGFYSRKSNNLYEYNNYENKKFNNEILYKKPILKGDIVSIYGCEYTNETVIETKNKYGYMVTLNHDIEWYNYHNKDIPIDINNKRDELLIHTNRIAQWFPTDFIQKKKMVISELPIYIKALHMKKITNFVINYKTKRSIEW